MIPLYPLRFQPIFRQYLWGGRRLATSLGKSLPPGDGWAECWEVADHGPDQSVVAFGPLAGTPLGQLVSAWGKPLLGRNDRPASDFPFFSAGENGTVPFARQARFPLLMKLLDAQKTLSVQVHPDDARAARLDPPDLGKTEAWYIVEAAPGSLIYAGLKPGIDRPQLAAAISEGRCQECLHAVSPSPGDCFFLRAGAVHALGAGLLVAEIQQASDVTYRLYDWDRVGPDGRKRPLHVENAMECIDFTLGPVAPQRADPTGRPQASRLVECEKFVWDRWEFDAPLSAGGDDRCHILTVLQGAIEVERDPAGCDLPCGGTVLLPASVGGVRLYPRGKTVLLDAFLP
jgi:mannose-6-phosphate isomerase